MQEAAEQQAHEEVTDRVFTVANVITFIRLCMAPVALVLLIGGHDIEATAVFAVSALTDFLDGQIARRTHTVSRVGQMLDPAVDRLLMICAVVGLLVVGRLPIWIVVFVLIRDVVLMVGGAYLYRVHGIRVPVIYAGKFATTFLFVGMAGLMLNTPQIPGLGLVDAAWLPGFNSMMYSWGIWLVYIGLCLALFTTIYYVVRASKELHKALREETDARPR